MMEKFIVVLWIAYFLAAPILLIGIIIQFFYLTKSLIKKLEFNETQELKKRIKSLHIMIIIFAIVMLSLICIIMAAGSNWI